jgi:predicted GIY-YIG superfamily endonuclease
LWNDIKSEDVAGEDYIIDKYELVKDFLHGTYKELKLCSPKDLSDFLDKEGKSLANSFGVYCIYNANKNQVLYIGKSKRLGKRLREQLIGIQSKNGKVRNFTRLFFATIKVEKKTMEKTYDKLPDNEKEKYIDDYLKIIFTPDNYLRICVTKDHIKAIVLENTLIQYFNGKYNFQVD